MKVIVCSQPIAHIHNIMEHIITTEFLMGIVYFIQQQVTSILIQQIKGGLFQIVTEEKQFYLGRLTQQVIVLT